MPTQTARARPFLKWAGGKGQLLAQIDALLPEDLKAGRIRHYVEPFLGGGAVFFHLTQQYRIERAELYDLNADLVLAWRVVRDRVEALVETLEDLAAPYLEASAADRPALYYRVREAFNDRTRLEAVPARLSAGEVRRAAQLLFLNRTGYNGLFRLNASGGFNVPHGRYANPRICDAGNLRAASACLQEAVIEVRDFGSIAAEEVADAFVYLDPPYRPLSKTSSFTAYRGRPFDDAEQARLAEAVRRFAEAGARCLVSNSDPTNTDPGDDFFQRIYGDGFSYHRIDAARMINSNGARRGRLRELAIRNY
jgi:DNA adenine methylase